MPKPSPKSVPVLTTDKDAEDFLNQDLSALDLTQFKPMRSNSLPKSAPPPKRPWCSPPDARRAALGRGAAIPAQG